MLACRRRAAADAKNTPRERDEMTIPQEVADTIVDPKAYADGRMYESYAWLRANQPMGVARPTDYDPFRVVTRHADILEISRQNELFHSGDRATTIVNKAVDDHVRKQTGGSPHLVRSLVQMDAPDHPKYRALTQAWFMPRNMQGLDQRIRNIARASVERMAAKGGECDFVREVALHYPLHVIMEILGVPEEDEPRMLMLTQELFGATDPELGRAPSATAVPGDRSSIQAVLADFYQYFAQISADRRANPRDDLATVIATSQVDGRPISEFEAMSYYVIVATAGHDTTSWTTAGARRDSCKNPDQFAYVKQDLSRVPGLIDDALRWTTQIKTNMPTNTA